MFSTERLPVRRIARRLARTIYQRPFKLIHPLLGLSSRALGPGSRKTGSLRREKSGSRVKGPGRQPSQTKSSSARIASVIRHCEPRGGAAIQRQYRKVWIASRALAMTESYVGATYGRSAASYPPIARPACCFASSTNDCWFCTASARRRGKRRPPIWISRCGASVNSKGFDDGRAR